MSNIALSRQLSYSLRRQYIDEFLARSIASSRAGQTLVDVGGVKERHRGEFDLENLSLQVVAINISPSKGMDTCADASRLPLVSQSFEWALCSEVLEHVQEPLLVLAEIFRVLRPGGTALLTVPFLFRLHPDPEDVSRYTHWFWSEKLAALGFNEIKIEKQGLFRSVIIDMLREWMRFQVIDGRFRIGIMRSLLARVIRGFRKIAIRLDTKAEYQEHPFWGQYTTGYGISAKKPI